ncbi:MAG TPA: phosphoribosylanthranilate isomerase [Bacillus bacterium]|nr:phosphoribosylanthranilate isomerase [Bacillus sp. (in: firmicutes)]
MRTVKVKLCGNHSLQDLQFSVQSGADFIGIVFAESKRKVDPVQCGEWIHQIEKESKQKYVGIFVNPSLREISDVLQHVPLDIIQFHGNESPMQIVEAKMATGLTVWKAIHHCHNSIERMKDYHRVADGYVIDSKVKGAWGGTGERFDWEAIPSYQKEAEQQGVGCLIAGGITPDNVKRILQYHPHGIDISSGIETNGIKDYQKIQLLIDNLNPYQNA